jgi:hypothetical protein
VDSAVIWERQVGDDELAIADITEPVPYGLKIAEDCAALEQDVQEREALLAMLEMIIQDKPRSQTAEELNRRGFAPASIRSRLQDPFSIWPRVGGSARQTSSKHHGRNCPRPLDPHTMQGNTCILPGRIHLWFNEGLFEWN